MDRNLPAGVLGAGTMGSGIAQVLAYSGYDVQLWDLSKEQLDQGMERIQKRLDRLREKGRLSQAEMDQIRSRIHLTPQLEDLAPCEWVIEAVVERLDIKRDLLFQLEKIVGKQTVLATNTSSLSVTSIASSTNHPERVLGLHFFNPAPVMPLVEVVSGMRTDVETVQCAVQFVRTLGKDPVKVADFPGFLVNRIARPFHLEGYRLVGEHVADRAQVDRILRSAGFKMGPFELQDMIGIDVNYAASVSVYEGFFHEPRYRPHIKQRLMVESGSLGQKTGRGHYSREE
ncbi:3-hydroxyacyl-CoA dehydrogenase family protein [Melghirimyces algeriensis]|uniref:3-hydroxybutyryl-CoA dehydrogenase n=1 Tax=Melghirimyces algeriensis TaxID=910412 RepID=A0A521F7Y9_9BACL|nr:3-hydroxyacyl-CoA dehydrogenase NAD-binding domain-containing protein [Melghirimyces algeriensis]SMO92283.1 3-hydroxybutyryl-CoA dehydrogenase [Melghirimyces algeriensis]